MQGSCGEQRAERARPPFAPRSPSAAEFVAFLEVHPASLALWEAGASALYPFLCWLEVEPVARVRQAVSEGDRFAPVALSRWHHNQVGLCVAWALQHMSGRESSSPPTESDRLAAFDLARRYWVIKNVMAEVRQGSRSFRARGRRIEVAFTGDVGLDALDRFLDLVDGIDSMPSGLPPGVDRVASWLGAGGRDVPWRSVGHIQRELYREWAGHEMRRHAFQLPNDIELGGFTVADGRAVLRELLAQGLHANAAIFFGTTSSEVALPVRSRSELAAQVERDTGVPRLRLDPILDLLTADIARCPDPCLTPLIPIGGDSVVSMSSLIVPGAPLRNLVDRVNADPARSGAVGRKLGLIGNQAVAQTVRSRLGSAALVEERVDVYAADGQRVGDLDVVAIDPQTGEAAVMEVLWEIGPDGSAQVARTEVKANAKRAQVVRIRTALANGAQPRWPPGWRLPGEIRYRWFILTPDVLPVVPLDDDGIIVRSHQLLERSPWSGSRVRDMVRALESPTPPPVGGGTTWRHLRFGPFDVKAEFVIA